MNYSNYRITLDVQSDGSGVILRAKQADTGRMLRISLIDGGVPYPLTRDCFAVFSAKKPDGHILFNECSIEGNEILYRIREQTLTAAGALACEIRVYGSNNMLLTSAKFSIVADALVLADGEIIESTDDLSALTSLITQNQQTMEDLLRLKEELEEIIAGGGGGGTGGGGSGKDGVTFYPEVDNAGYLTWTNNGGLKNPEPVYILGPRGPQGIQGSTGAKGADGKDGKDGYTPVKGVDYYTEAEKEALVQEVLDLVPSGGELPKVSEIDFANYSSGSFTEKVDGKAVNHTVTFDSQGRPSKIDDVVIKWG